MALIITDNQHYSNIASAIRTKLGTNETFAPAEMASAIMSISGGGEVIQDQEGYIVLPSGGGGGGGGGVFKSANVTIIPSPEHGSDFSIYDPGYSEEPWGFHCCFLENGQIVGGTPSGVSEETTYTLYYIGDSLEVYPSTTYESSTGAVTWNPDTNILTITGDCTITGYIDD